MDPANYAGSQKAGKVTKSRCTGCRLIGIGDCGGKIFVEIELPVKIIQHTRHDFAAREKTELQTVSTCSEIERT